MPTTCEPQVSGLLPRGVYRAPYLTEDGDMVLFAVDHRHRIIPDGMMMLEPGSPMAVESSATLWRRLDAADPEHRPPAGRRGGVLHLP
jgi:hypothetical protein